MSDLQKQYDALTKQSKELQTQVNELYEKRRLILLEQDEVRHKIIFEEKVLNEKPWVLKITDSGEVYLDGGYDDDRPRLNLLCDTSGYGDYSFYADDIAVHSSDGDVTMSFRNQENFLDAVHHWDLNISLDKINEQVNELEGKLSGLKTIIEDVS